ncbi:MAG: hypothetical protein ABI579_03365 [Candidatus Sumerlaeota bacterium]
MSSLTTTRERFYLCALIAVQVLVVLWSGRHELSPDEARYAWAVSQSWRDMFAWLSTDNHPPLYLIFLKCWAGVFGISETGLRASNIVWAPLMTVAFFRGCRNFLTAGTALFVTTLFCLNPLYLFICGIAKYYLAFMLVSFVATAKFQQIITKLETKERLSISPLVGWGAMCALLLWTHYLGGILLFYFASLLVIVARRNIIGPPLIALALAGATFLPWVLVLLGQLQEQLSPPAFSVAQYAFKAAIRVAYTSYAFMFGTTLELGRFIVVAMGCVSALCVIAAVSLRAGRHDLNRTELTAVMIFAAGGLFGLGGAMIVMMVMLPGHPDLSMPERVSFILPHLVLLVGWLVLQIRNRVKQAALLLYAIPCAVSLWHLLRWDENNAWDYLVPWKEIATEVESQPMPRVVIFDSDSFGAEGWYYLSQHADSFIDHRSEREAETLGDIAAHAADASSVVFIRSVRDGTPLESLNMTESNLQKAFGKPDREAQFVSDSGNLKVLKDFVRRTSSEQTFAHKIRVLIYHPPQAPREMQ